MTWQDINHLLDEGVVIAGIALLIVRQFLWRSTDLRRMVRLPLLIIAAGVVYLFFEMGSGLSFATADWILVGELAVVAVTGVAMGFATRFRWSEGQLQYKLKASGIWLWGFFVIVRIASFVLASSMGANLAGATGLILLSFGVSRLASVIVIRRRLAKGSGSPGLR